MTEKLSGQGFSTYPLSLHFEILPVVLFFYEPYQCCRVHRWMLRMHAFAHGLSLKTSALEQKWSMHRPQAKAGPSSYVKQFIFLKV